MKTTDQNVVIATTRSQEISEQSQCDGEACGSGLCSKGLCPGTLLLLGVLIVMGVLKLISWTRV